MRPLPERRPAHLWVRWFGLAEAPPPADVRLRSTRLQPHSAATTQTASPRQCLVQTRRIRSVAHSNLFNVSAMASDTVFLSALQPNTSVTTYGLPSDIQVGNGSSMSNETAKARRVQQQVQMRLAEKSTLPRQNGPMSQYAMSGKHQVSLLALKRNFGALNFCFVACVRARWSQEKWWI